MDKDSQIELLKAQYALNTLDSGVDILKAKLAGE